MATGPAAAIDELQATLVSEGVSCGESTTSHAFHSPVTAEALDGYRDVLRQVAWSSPTVPYISSLTGAFVLAEEAIDPEYWLGHLRQAVRLADGFETLLSSAAPLMETRIFMEVGPGDGLSRLLRKHPRAQNYPTITTLPGREEGDQSAARVLQRAIGEAWLSGASIDWKGYNAQARCRRVPLPTYPFEQQRFWIDAEKEAIAGARPSAAPDRRELRDWFHMPSWRLAPPVALAAGSSGPVRSSCCIVFAAATEFSRALIVELQRHTTQVIVVRPGGSYAYGDRAATVDVSQASHYLRLLDDVKGEGWEVDAVVHALNVGAHEDVEWQFDPAALERSLYSVLYLCQALSARSVDAAVRLSLLGSGMVKIATDDVLRPHSAVLPGVCRVIPRELPGVSCRCIDIADAIRSPAHIDTLAACIALESLSDTKDSIVAYRGDRRWLQTFEGVPLDSAGDDLGMVRHGGVYLITGGLGGMGLALAEHLAEVAQARLILIGRSGIPPRCEWEKWLDNAARDKTTTRKIQAIQRMEELGSEVLCMTADVADEGQMRGVVQAALERFGTIHGVVHAAGVAGGGVMSTKTKEFVANVTRPKIQGTVVVHDAVAGLQLDFFVLCSSMNSIVGGFGQYDYCAANAFQDAFATYHDGRGATRHVSINWDAWKEVGLAAETEVPDYLRAQRAQHLESAILTSEGIDAFARLMRRPLPQWLVVTQSPDVLLSTTQERDVGEEVVSVDVRSSPRPELPTAYVAPRTGVEEKLAGIWEELLGVAGIGIHDNFFDLGGDSLLITRLLTMMRTRIPDGSEGLSLKLLFENSTIAKVAMLIADQREAQRYSEQITALRSTSTVTEEGEI
ncbi:MAG: SDR family NAD(P)-dependent oxidoreductase [Lysobacter sp.]|nr:SDR family NAD(P)-dependent oxidoreductase [Lysobacter sp.]